jgi:P-type conjugative transfer protein VirB9
MRQFSWALLVAVSSLPIPVTTWAAATPSGSAFDSRIQSVRYRADDVVVVHTAVGVGTAIVFDDGEEIANVASGFSSAWEFVTKHNILYIKPKSVTAERVSGGVDGGLGVKVPPKAGLWRTNLLVTTDKRLYAFDLFIGPPAKAAFRVQFAYPEEVAAKEQAAKVAALVAAKPIEATDMDRKAPPLNYAYTMQVGRRSEAVAPTAAWDDGRFTYLRFESSRDLPSVFLRKEGGTEEMVNTHVESSASDGEEDTIVVHGVYRQVVLRSGSAVVFVNDEGFDVASLPPLEGTTVPGVRRVIKGDQGSEKVLP